MHTCIPVDEEVDGETLLTLANFGSMEQLKACGFATVKQQMRLRKLLLSVPASQSASSTSLPAHSACASAIVHHHTGKLTLGEIKQMSVEEKHLYLIK